MRLRNICIGCVCAASMIVAAPVVADHTIEGVEFEGGEMELATVGHWNFDPRADIDDSAAVETSLTRAWNDRLALTLANSAERTPNGSLTAQSLNLAAIVRLSNEVAAPWVWGGIMEYARSLKAGGADEIEVGAIIERNTSSGNLAANLKATRTLDGRGDEDWEALLHYTRGVRDSLGFGFEIFDLPAEDSRRERQLGPCVHVDLRWGDRVVEIAAAGLVGATDAAPDATLRLMVAISR